MDSVISSPYERYFTDNGGKTIRISITFNNSTRAITGGTVARDIGCTLTHLAIGLGPDGTPDTSPRIFAVSEGSTNLNANAFSNRGLNVIEDVIPLQVTALTL